jgi:hypothetical protein
MRSGHGRERGPYRERDDRRLNAENDLAAEDVVVETGGTFDVRGDDEVRARFRRRSAWEGLPWLCSSHSGSTATASAGC